MKYGYSALFMGASSYIFNSKSTRLALACSLQVALCGARVHAVHVGKGFHGLAAGLEGVQQRFFAGVLCSQFDQGFVEQRLGLGIADVHAGAVVVARETAGVDGDGEEKKVSAADRIAAAPAKATGTAKK